MKKKGFSQRIKAVLKALDFTTKTLAISLGISEYKARRILSPTGTILASEFFGIVNLLRNMDCNLLMEGAEAITKK